MNAPFRESIRYHQHFNGTHVDKFGEIAEAALSEHGFKEITHHNAAQVFRTMERHSDWKRLGATGPMVKEAVAKRVGYKLPEDDI